MSRTALPFLLVLALAPLRSAAQDTVALPLVEDFDSWSFNIPETTYDNLTRHGLYRGWEACISGISGPVLTEDFTTGNRSFLLTLIDNRHHGTSHCGGTTLATPYLATLPTHLSFSVNPWPPFCYGDVYLPNDTAYLEVGYIDDAPAEADWEDYCHVFHPIDTLAFPLANRWDHVCLDLTQYPSLHPSAHRLALRTNSTLYYPAADTLAPPTPDTARGIFCWMGIDSLYLAQARLASCDTLDIADTLCHHTPYDRYGLHLADDYFDTPGDYTFETHTFRTLNRIALHVEPTPVTHLADSLLPGDTLLFADTLITAPCTYTLRLASHRGCDSTVVLHVRWRLWDPAHTFINPKIANPCQGDTLQLLAHGIDAIHWVAVPDDPDIHPQQGHNPIFVSPRQTTVYYLLQPDSSIHPSLSATITPKPTPTPCIALSPSVLDFDRPTLTFTDCSDSSALSRWILPDGTALSGPTHRYTFHHPLPDTLRLRLTTCSRFHCCADTVAALPVSPLAVWFPNAFTPGLEPNALFAPATTLDVTDYRLDIYNRRGQCIFTTDRIDTPWIGDGHPQGAYPYRWSLRTAEGRFLRGTGTVTLIR